MDGVLYLRINTVRGIPPVSGVKGIFGKVTVGNQQPVETDVFSPLDLTWNHFMSFDSRRNDQVKIEFFVQKKSLLKTTTYPYGMLTISLKGVKNQIQEKWLTLLPQKSEIPKGQVQVELYYHEHSIEMEGVDKEILSKLENTYIDMEKKGMGDIVDNVEDVNYNDWIGKASYLYIKSQKTGNKKRRFLYLMPYSRQIAIYKQQQLRYKKQREESEGEIPKTIDLAFAKIEDVPNTCEFIVATPERKYRIDAGTSEEKSIWIKKINEELKSLDEFSKKDMSQSMSQNSMSTFQNITGVIPMLRNGKFVPSKIELRSGFIFMFENAKKNAKMLGKLSLYKCEMAEYDYNTYPNSIIIKDQYKKKNFIFQLEDEINMHMWLNKMKIQQLFIEESIDNIQII